MTTVSELNAQRKQAGLPLIRFHIRRLQPEDIQDLRDAYAALYEISDTAVGDSRGFTAIARGHGFDQDLCHTDSRLFLTWHRAYIYAFEKTLNGALQWKRGNPNIELTLPYWDWTQFDAAKDAPNGIPQVIDELNYTDAAGQTQPNPLASARSLYREVSQGLSGNDVWTVRYPAAFRTSIPDLADDVARNLSNPSFSGFSDDLNFGAHGAIHVDVGGTSSQSALPGGAGDMRQVVSAAFDPIFWLHHSMIDKVWFDWQTAHPNANVPQHVLDSIAYGGMRGSALINAEASLRYIYSDDEVEAAVVVGGTVDPDADDVSMPELDATPTDIGEGAESAKPAEIYLGTVRGPYKRAQLDFYQLRPPQQSYEIRAFINNPEANADTARDHESYAGRMVLFGHGRCHGAPGHCNPLLAVRDKYDLRPKHPLRYTKTRYCLDLTRGLRRYMAGESVVDNIRVYLVTVGMEGKMVPARSIKYGGVSLSTLV